MTLSIAALASGGGSNVAAIIKSIERGNLDARVAVVLSNNPGAPVLDRARAAGVPVWTRSHEAFADREAFDGEMMAVIRDAKADTIALAGYMRMLSTPFVQAFAGRILNIHPALLPSFPGLHGVGDAVAHGARFSGATVHFVDEHMDHGPIIIQAITPVGTADNEESVTPRVHALEHRIYPQALQWLAENRIELEGRRVRLLPRIPHVELASSGDNGHGPWMICPPLEPGF